MRTGRPKAELALSQEEFAQLQSFARSRSLPASLSQRARIVLGSAEGEPNNAIAQRLNHFRRHTHKWLTNKAICVCHGEEVGAGFERR